MKSGLCLNCWLILLACCTQPNSLQSAEHALPDSSQPQSAARQNTNPKIRLVGYPGNFPPSGLGAKNPWQSNGGQSNRGGSDFTSSRSAYRESSENLIEPPPFQNSIPEIRRVNKPIGGYSSPPGFESSTAVGRSGRSYPTMPRGAMPRIIGNQGIQQISSAKQTPDFERAAPFQSSEGGVVYPPDWNPGVTDVAPVRSQEFRARDYAYQEVPATTIRRNAHRDSRVVSPSYSTPADQAEPVSQTEYVETSTPNLDREIPLRPGQALPGFKNPALRPSRTARVAEARFAEAAEAIEPEREVVSPSPRVNAATRLPPPTLRSPADALRVLTSATEHEIATLSPGETATDLQFYIERHVYMRLLYLMAGQTERALRPIPNIPPADQEFWTQVLWGVHSYFDLHQVPNPAERAAQTIAQFNAAILRLKERAPLQLKNVVFSNKIHGYGEYDTYPKDEFAPGERVLVYAEISNFHSELTAQGMYRTRLKSALQFSSVDSPEESIESKAYPVTEDFCRNHRRDYFHSYVVDIPARCGKGRHILKLIIEDELSGKTAEYPVQFNVR
jgi:hypothetical protein